VVLIAVGAMGACSAPDRVAAPAGHTPVAAAEVASSDDAEPPPREVRTYGIPLAAWNDSVMWAMVAKRDSLFAVGLKLPGKTRGLWRGSWLLTKQDRVAHLATLSRLTGLSAASIDPDLPLARVRLSSPGQIAQLRSLPFVDYVEPAKIPGEMLKYNSFGGCSSGGSAGEYTVDSMGDALPRTFSESRVDRAWAYSTGAGVWMGIVDTGVYPFNSKQAWDFATGASAGRSAPVHHNFTADYRGVCQHGTYMAGVAAGPRNGLWGVGVAYRANLLNVQFESGVINALEYDAMVAVNDAVNFGAKVILMAYGVLFHVNALEDAISRGYFQTDVVFVGAAGTTYADLPKNFVVFPASLSTVLSASAADFDGLRDNQSHYGPELDVVAYQPSTTTAHVGNGLYAFGNSSNATAITGGLAALLRSRYPTWTNQQVVSRIVSTAGLSCGKGTAFGPIINAEAAVGGICVQQGRPIGPQTVLFEHRAGGDNRSSATETYCLNVSGGIGGVQIVWADGAQTSCRQFTFSRGTYATRINVTARDLGVGLPAAPFYLDVQVTDLDTSCPTCASNAPPREPRSAGADASQPTSRAIRK